MGKSHALYVIYEHFDLVKVILTQNLNKRFYKYIAPGLTNEIKIKLYRKGSVTKGYCLVLDKLYILDP